MVSVAVPRVILHLDLDAFYAAVEVRENPSLSGKPLIIGHRGRRGVVSTCSYEARKFGVRSAMPSVIAERLCPEAIWLPGRMDLYARVSGRIREIFRNFTPIVEPLSIDEAFLDLTGIARDLHAGAATARALQKRIRTEQGLSASAGVASNKFLAKVASDLEKPGGLVVIPSEEVPERLWPLPVERLWGVGPKTAAILHRGGLRTIRQILEVSERSLAALVGEGSAGHLRALARGEDDRPVAAGRESKSISEERTYAVDLVDPDDVDRALLARSEGVARQLRREGLVGRTVHLKVRTGDFTTWTRSRTLPDPTDLTETIVRAARGMYREKIDLGGKGIRLLGIGMSGLDRAGRGQASLFLDPGEERARRMARAADAVRDRLGEDTVVRARLLRRRGKPTDDDAPPEASSPPSVD